MGSAWALSSAVFFFSIMVIGLSFVPPGLDAGDDRGLEVSYRLAVEFVPALLRLEGGREMERIEGWHRERWESVSDERRPASRLDAIRLASITGRRAGLLDISNAPAFSPEIRRPPPVGSPNRTP